MHLFGFIIRIYHDARSRECKIREIKLPSIFFILYIYWLRCVEFQTELCKSSVGRSLNVRDKLESLYLFVLVFEQLALQTK